MDKIKQTFTIRIENSNVECYVVENGDRYISANVRRALTPSFALEMHSILDSDNEVIQIYTINEVMEGIKPRTMKELARKGLIQTINEGLSNKENEKKEDTLSDFDRVIMRTLKFNPNEREG